MDSEVLLLIRDGGAGRGDVGSYGVLVLVVVVMLLLF